MRMTGTDEQVEGVLGPIDEDVDLIRSLVAAIETGYKDRKGQKITKEELEQIDRHVVQLQSHHDALIPLQSSHGVYAKDLEGIKNLLMDLQKPFLAWPVDSAGERVADPEHLGKMRQTAQALLRRVRLVRIPLIINERHLRHLRTGRSFDFLKEYETDLGLEEVGTDMRKEMLGILKKRGDIDGWVDEDAGVIYKASPRWRRRLLSFALVFGFPLLGLVVFPLILPSFAPSGVSWSPRAIAVNYMFLFAGFVTHVIKKALEGQKTPLLDDLLVWIHVKEWPLIGVGASVWMVFLGLGAFNFFPDLSLYKEVDTTSALSVFTSGVAIDSIAAGVLKQYQGANPAGTTRKQSAVAT